MHQMLQEVDPVSAEEIHENNVKRVIRALEFYHQNRNCLSPAHNETGAAKRGAALYNLAYFVLNDAKSSFCISGLMPRVDQMLATGTCKRSRKTCRKMGCHKGMVSMQGLGYKEILAYLEGEYPLDEALCILKRDTRHFAKRQLTWFRREQDVIWVNKDQFAYNDQEILNYMLSCCKERGIL